MSVSYNGYSFYKSSYDQESVDCSIVSSDYKVSDKINDLNTSKYTKETRLQLSSSRRKTESFYDLNEISEKQVVSPEPTIVRPHVGENIKTIRERNLDEYFRDTQTQELRESASPNLVSEFLESFDTKVQDEPEVDKYSFIDSRQLDESLHLPLRSEKYESNKHIVSYMSKTSHKSNAHQSKFALPKKKLESFKIQIDNDNHEKPVFEIKSSVKVNHNITNQNVPPSTLIPQKAPPKAHRL